MILGPIQDYSQHPATHHTLHYGRLQLGLFLKGLGLNMEESLRFWKSEFTRKNDIDGDKFEKQYAYNIRHSYGQEGKRNDYKPWNCSKTINLTAPGPGEYHGCPFKTFSDENLIQLLSSYGISKQELRVILDKKENNLHQVACLRLFESTHKNGVAENVGNHPNSFFSSALAYEKATKKAEKKAEQKAANDQKTTDAVEGQGSPAAPKAGTDDAEMAAQ